MQQEFVVVGKGTSLRRSMSTMSTTRDKHHNDHDDDHGDHIDNNIDNNGDLKIDDVTTTLPVTLTRVTTPPLYQTHTSSLQPRTSTAHMDVHFGMAMHMI